jgi:hypothetical protein
LRPELGCRSNQGALIIVRMIAFTFQALLESGRDDNQTQAAVSLRYEPIS